MLQEANLYCILLWQPSSPPDCQPAVTDIKSAPCVCKIDKLRPTGGALVFNSPQVH
jgi:hypothetical protein